MYEHYYDFAFKIVFRYVWHHEVTARLVNTAFVEFFRNYHLFIKSQCLETEDRIGEHIKGIMVKAGALESINNRLLAKPPKNRGDIWENVAAEKNAEELLFYQGLVSHLRNLPEMARAVFNMYVIDGYTHQQIATLLNIPEKSSQSELLLARVFLKKLIAEELVR